MTQAEKLFKKLGVTPNEVFELKGQDGKYRIDSNLILYVYLCTEWEESDFSIADIISGEVVIIKKTKEKGCEYCNQTPVFEKGKDGKLYYDYCKSSMTFASSSYEAACIGANEKGEIVMWVSGEDRSDEFPLNYCPECGRKLREDK